MASQPFASVIVPAHNAAATLGAALESLLSLDYPAERMEVVAVDNASTDATAEILERFGDRITVVREARRGPAAARNAGLAVAEGEVVAFTDADCVVDPRWLSRLVTRLETEAGSVVAGRILAAPGANWVQRFGEQIHDHRLSVEVFQPPYVITMNFATSRASLPDGAPFDERLRRGEDVDLSWRLFAAGRRFAFEPEAVVYHHNERTLRGLGREGFQHGFYAVQVLKKHRALVRIAGERRLALTEYRAIAGALADGARGRDRPGAVCMAVFNAGKAAGRVAGSLWFRYPSL